MLKSVRRSYNLLTLFYVSLCTEGLKKATPFLRERTGFLRLIERNTLLPDAELTVVIARRKRFLQIDFRCIQQFRKKFLLRTAA